MISATKVTQEPGTTSAAQEQEAPKTDETNEDPGVDQVNETSNVTRLQKVPFSTQELGNTGDKNNDLSPSHLNKVTNAASNVDDVNEIPSDIQDNEEPAASHSGAYHKGNQGSGKESFSEEYEDEKPTKKQNKQEYETEYEPKGQKHGTGMGYQEKYTAGYHSTGNNAPGSDYYETPDEYEIDSGDYIQPSKGQNNKKPQTQQQGTKPAQNQYGQNGYEKPMAQNVYKSPSGYQGQNSYTSQMGTQYIGC